MSSRLLSTNKTPLPKFFNITFFLTIYFFYKNTFKIINRQKLILKYLHFSKFISKNKVTNQKNFIYIYKKKHYNLFILQQQIFYQSYKVSLHLKSLIKNYIHKTNIYNSQLSKCCIVKT